MIGLSDFLAYGENGGRKRESKVKFDLPRWKVKVLTKSISQIQVSLQYAPRHSHLRQGLLALQTSAAQHPEPAWLQHQKNCSGSTEPHSAVDTRSAGASGCRAPGETGFSEIY